MFVAECGRVAVRISVRIGPRRKRCGYRRTLRGERATYPIGIGDRAVNGVATRTEAGWGAWAFFWTAGVG